MNKAPRTDIIENLTKEQLQGSLTGGTVHVSEEQLDGCIIPASSINSTQISAAFQKGLFLGVVAGIVLTVVSFCTGACLINWIL